jgi:hypothetical protein
LIVGCSIGFILVAFFRQRSTRTRRGSVTSYVCWHLLGLVVPIAFAGSAWAYRGTTADPYTAVCFFGPLLWPFVLWSAIPERKEIGVVAPVLFYAYVLVARPHYSVFDLSHGDTGVLLDPGLVFVRPGVNSQVIGDYLGACRPRHLVLGADFVVARDGNNRVDSRSLVFDPCLRDILKIFPTDASRRQVLSCLVDPDNRVRVHQNLLLAYLLEKHLPAGLSAQLWWNQHLDVFVRVASPVRAVEMTWGWCDDAEALLHSEPEPSASFPVTMRQLRAARYQERGQWGGDRLFSAAHSDYGTDSVIANRHHSPFSAWRIDTTVTGSCGECADEQDASERHGSP